MAFRSAMRKTDGAFRQEEQLMKKRILYSTVAALMVLPAISMAAETEENKIKTLDEVVVTATRALQKISKQYRPMSRL